LISSLSRWLSWGNPTERPQDQIKPRVTDGKPNPLIIWGLWWLCRSCFVYGGRSVLLIWFGRWLFSHNHNPTTTQANPFKHKLKRGLKTDKQPDNIPTRKPIYWFGFIVVLCFCPFISRWFSGGFAFMVKSENRSLVF